jgi:hypothetical protein
MAPALAVKEQMVEQPPYHYLHQLSPLAAAAPDLKEQMAQREQMVAVADIVIMLEQRAQLEDSQAAMPMAMAVVEAVAQEPQALQEAREEMVEMVC